MKAQTGILSVAVATLVFGTSSKGQEVLTFSGLQDQEAIGSYYAGGLGGDGSGPGPNYGITFGSDSLALISSFNGGSGNFQNAPGGDTVAFFLYGPGDVMDVAGGFNTGFSFFYASTEFPGSVSVFSGPDGTGTDLADLNLPTTPSVYGLPFVYNTWEPIGVTFAGTADSVVFSGSANEVAFSDVTLGSASPGSVPDVAPPGSVPDAASTVSMFGMSVAGLLGFARRFKK